MTGQQRPSDPTPEQIAERAGVIRQDWSDRVHRERAGLRGETEWIVPRVKNAASASSGE